MISIFNLNSNIFNLINNSISPNVVVSLEYNLFYGKNIYKSVTVNPILITLVFKPIIKPMIIFKLITKMNLRLVLELL